MTIKKSRVNKTSLTVDKRQVKLMLPLVLHQELQAEARAQGLSLATYLRALIYQNRLSVSAKNVKINSQKRLSEADNSTLQRMRGIF
jgi:hypothetical protein